MTVVHHEFAAQGARGEVVDAAGAVGDVAHDDGVRARVLRDDVGDGRPEHAEALGELKRHPLCLQ